MKKSGNHMLLSWLMVTLLITFVFGLAGVFYRIYHAETWSVPAGETITYKLNSYDYPLTDSARVIEMGVQPLWVPASIITQMMQYDQVLREMLRAKNYEIRFYNYYKGADLIHLVEMNQLEVGVAGDMPVLMGAASLNIEVVAPVQQGFTSIVASKYSLVEQLKNKRVGYAFGTNAHLSLISSLENHGISVDDVRMVPMNIYHMIEALHQNEIDAFAAWEPIPAMAMHKYSDQKSIHKSFTMGFLVFNKEFCKQNPEAVLLVAAAEIRAFNWLQESRSNLLKGVEWSLADANQFLVEGKIELTNYQVSTLAKKDLLANADFPSLDQAGLDTTGFVYRQFHNLKKWSFISDTTGWSVIRSSFNQNIVPEIQKNPARYRIYEYNYLPVSEGDKQTLLYD